MRRRCLIQKLTFRDRAYRDARGNPDPTNFAIKGCVFSKDGQFVYILASKYRYKSFVVAYAITPVTAEKILFTPHTVLDVHDQFASALGISPDSQYLSVTTSDGFVKVVDRPNMKVLLSQKRNNLPTTCHGWFSSNQDLSPSHIFIGSADYTYNLVAIPAGASFVGSLLKHLVFVVLVQLPILLAIMVYLAKE